MRRFIIAVSKRDVEHFQANSLAWEMVGGVWIGAEDVAQIPNMIGESVFIHRDPSTALFWSKRFGVVVSNWLPWIVDALADVRPNFQALSLWVENQSENYPFDFVKGVNRIPCFSEFAVSSFGIKVRPALEHSGFVHYGSTRLRLREALESAMPSNEQVAVAISGGVDSALVAALLKDRGNFITGFTMASRTPGTDERSHVRQTSMELHIPLVEFDIDDIPILLPRGKRDWYWGPQHMPTEVHESRFFEFIKSRGFDQVWTGFGADQLMSCNNWTRLMNSAVSNAQWREWKIAVRALAEGKDRTFRQEFASHSWDLAIRNLNRLEVSNEIDIVSPFLSPTVLDLMMQVVPEELYAMSVDKPLIRDLLSDLLGKTISDKPKLGTMTSSVVERLQIHHDVSLSPPFVRNWRAVSQGQWLRYAE